MICAACWAYFINKKMNANETIITGYREAVVVCHYFASKVTYEKEEECLTAGWDMRSFHLCTSICCMSAGRLNISCGLLFSLHTT